VSVKSFSVGHADEQPITFDVDGDEFQAVPASRLPGSAFVDLASMGEASTAQQLAMVGHFLDMALVPDSAVRFAARMRDAGQPITLATATDVMVWLVEEVYTGRPTQQPLASPSGAQPDGSGSTAGVPPTGVTPLASVQGG